MGELVHLRLDNKMRGEMKAIIRKNLFSNESEFIRDAIRNNIETYKKIRMLEALQNSLPLKGSKKKTSDIFREFGIT